MVLSFQSCDEFVSEICGVGRRRRRPRCVRKRPRPGKDDDDDCGAVENGSDLDHLLHVGNSVGGIKIDNDAY
jgi:hypothetical protein